MASKDFTSIPNTTANEIQENITIHNILVMILITHYIKDYSKGAQNRSERSRNVTDNSKFHRTFSMLILHLIQCPDLTFEELNNIISCGKYQLPKYFILTYHFEVQRVINSDLDAIIDMFKNLDGNLIDHGLPKVHQFKLVNSGSPVGLFLRRIMIFFDKMLFLQTEAIMKEVKNVCNAVINELPVRKS